MTAENRNMEAFYLSGERIHREYHKSGRHDIRVAAIVVVDVAVRVDIPGVVGVVLDAEPRIVVSGPERRVRRS